MDQSDETARRRELVEQLHEPATRRAARQKLVAAGAVEPLLECLRSTNESVVWAAVQSLGEMRATEAIGPLLELLDRKRLAFDVCEALTRVTGQDFGVDAARWREWARSHKPAAPARLDAADCVRQTGELLGVEPVGSGSSFRFRLPTADGRSQQVTAYFGREDAEGEEIVVVYSECGPAEPKLYEAVLRKNLSIPDGAFAIRDIDGKPNFVMVDTLAAAATTPRLLAKKIEHIARRADLVEKVLSRDDLR